MVRVSKYTKKDGTKVRSHNRNIRRGDKVPSRSDTVRDPIDSSINGRYFPSIIHRDGRVWFKRSPESDSKKKLVKIAGDVKKVHPDHEYMILERFEKPLTSSSKDGKYKLYGRIRPYGDPNKTVINTAQWQRLSKPQRYINAAGKRYVKVFTSSGTSLIPITMKK